jgi:hypothetical protein
MIAKEGWFVRRKYGGWGAYPKTWQGWVYVAVLVLPFVVMAALDVSGEAQLTWTGIIAVFLVAAFVDIMASIKSDEREVIHEAKAERNALWAIIAVLAAGVAYQTASGIVAGSQGLAVDPVILIALCVGVIVKAASNIYFDKRD